MDKKNYTRGFSATADEKSFYHSPKRFAQRMYVFRDYKAQKAVDYVHTVFTCAWFTISGGLWNERISVHLKYIINVFFSLYPFLIKLFVPTNILFKFQNSNKDINLFNI